MLDDIAGSIGYSIIIGIFVHLITAENWHKL